MNEPLSVRVEKKKGNARQMIPLPAGDDGSPQGTNYTKEDVKGLEEYLVNQWSGGGTYIITVNDSTQPVPMQMTWESFYSPAEFPEKVPPTLSAAAQVFPQPQQVRAHMAFPNGYPQGAQPQPQQVQGYYQQPQPQPQPNYYSVQPPPVTPTLIGGDAGERRYYEGQLRSFEGQLAKAREDAIAANHRQELERERTAQNERFSKLEQMIAALAQAQITAKPAVDPTIEAIKEQNRALEARLENERRERDAERRERELQEQIRRTNEETQRRIEDLVTAQQANKGMDPIMMMLQQLTQQHSVAMQEQQRNFTAQLASLQGQMMSPRDILAMAKDSSSGLDQATRAITNAYTDILQMSRQAVEQALQINNPGGSETVGLIREGMERAAGFAEKYIGGKVKEATVGQQSQAEMAKAQAAHAQAQAAAMQAQVQAEALRAQAAARAAAASAAAGAAQAPQQAPAQPVEPQPASVVNGAPSNAKPANGAGAPLDGWHTGPVPASANVAPPLDPKVRRFLGHTDDEWFGPLLPRVHELREGVARFIESLELTPRRIKADGHVDGVEPEQAANAILQAGMQVMQQGIPIAAMQHLFGQGRIADLLDVLLPDSPQPYRDEVTRMVLSTLQGGSEEEEEEEEEEGSDDEGQGDDGEDGQVQAKAPVVAAPSPRARA
jgi:hypothetical protein